MKSEIIAVGTELLLGEILDTNSQYLAQQMVGLGIDMFFVTHVGDNLGRLTDTVQRAMDRSDLIIMTGGLGPTEDDLTREAVAQALGETMTVRPELEEILRGWYARRNRPMPAMNIKQATLIPSAQAIDNPIGTAPGWWVEANNGRTKIACMPGVPHEMKKMWEEQVAPRLSMGGGGGVLVSRTLKTVGIGESNVAEVVTELIHSTNPTLATYAKQDGVHLRIAAKASSRERADAMIAEFEQQVRALTEHWVYGIDEETLAGAIGKLLVAQGLTVATMESASGGLLASYLTDTPGSSEWFKGGVVAYAADLKIASGVPSEVIQQHGTVSEETALAMATAARERTGADAGLGITGVAGPSEVEGKPVGTAFIAIDFLGERKVVGSLWSTTRLEFKRRAVYDALYLIWRALEDRRTAGVGGVRTA
ncbi:MAG: competence/damage-inducible protein A [Chloroflexi bacterium]|nr:competence/damage-inducible protein A [Chloroflexota bacterium]